MTEGMQQIVEAFFDALYEEGVSDVSILEKGDDYIIVSHPVGADEDGRVTKSEIAKIIFTRLNYSREGGLV